MADVVLKLTAENADLKAKLAESQAAIKALTAEVEKLNGASGTDELEQDLKKLADEAYNAERALEANNRELAASQQAQMNAAKATQESAARIEAYNARLTDLKTGQAGVTAASGKLNTALLGVGDSASKLGSIVSKVSPELGLLIAKFGEAAVPVAAVLGSLKGLEAALAGLEKHTNVLDSLGLGKDNLNAIQAAIHDLANPFSVIKGESEAWQIALSKAREDWGFIIGQTTEAKDAQEILTKFTEEHAKAVKKVAEEQAKVTDELEKATFGKSFAEAKAGVDGLLGSFDLLLKMNLAEKGPWADDQRKKVEEMDAFLKSLGDSVSKVVSPEKLAAFQAMRDRLNESADAAKAAAESQVPLRSAIEGTTEAIEEQIEVLRKQRTELLKAQGDILAQATDIQDRIEEATSPDTEGIQKLRDEIERLKDEDADLSVAFEQNEEVWTRRAQLFDLIAQKTDELRAKEKFQPDTAALAKAQDDFRRLLDDAAAQVEELPESARGAVASVIERYRSMNDAAAASALTVRDFKLEFAGAMATARLELGRLGDQAKVMIDNITEAMQKFQHDMESAAKFVADALEKGPLLQLKAILATMGDITKALPALAAAAEEAI